ncbi:aldo/keto reductase, partial [Streptomyces hundungensis]|uniref:aldo/keto reductase n=1 Tax=Streptomyces hundungensis TaxID=1077946 RepID=UPI0033FA6AE0
KTLGYTRVSGPRGELVIGDTVVSGKVALAWLLARGDDIVPIPGSRRAARVEENTAAAEIRLNPGQLARLDALPPAAGDHHTEEQMLMMDRL